MKLQQVWEGGRGMWKEIEMQRARETEGSQRKSKRQRDRDG